MKKTMKRKIAMFLSVILLFTTMLRLDTVPTVKASDTVTYAAGLTPSSSVVYEVEKTFEQAPLTFEATFKVTNPNAGRSIILGNYCNQVYADGSSEFINFELSDSGKPYLRAYLNGQQHEHHFHTVDDLRTGETVRVMLVIDKTEIRCYVNGKLAQTRTASNTANGQLPVAKFLEDLNESNITNNWAVGHDIRPNGNYYFDGTIYDVSVWSDVRTAKEIAGGNILNLDKTDSNLIAAYNFNTTENFGEDISGNGYDLKCTIRTKTGLTPTKSEVYATAETYSDLPLTFEATFKVDNTDAGRGIIIGSYYNQDYASSTSEFINLELYTSGKPYLRAYLNGRQHEHSFNEVADLRTGETVRVTLVIDETEMRCYINGELAQTRTVSNTSNGKLPVADFLEDFNNSNITNNWAVGHDIRPNNNYHFDGTIYGVTMWSDVRTADEIKTSSLDSLDTTDSDLIASYNFSKHLSNSEGKIYLSGNCTDISGNGYDLSRELLSGVDIKTSEEANYGVYSTASTERGIAFDAESTYTTKTVLSGQPYTVSTWIHLPEDFSADDRGGVILGNYSANGVACTSFEINTNGRPRFYHINEDGKGTSLLFECDVRSTGWVHLAYVVDDANDSVSCYVNGTFVGTESSKYDIDLSDVNIPYLLGGDLRTGNAQYFKGKILEAALYQNMLTASDIMTLYLDGLAKVDENAFAYYDLFDAPRHKDIMDVTENNNDIVVNSSTYVTDIEDVEDYAYSFAVIGDIQKITAYDVTNGTEYLSSIYDWILENKDEENIQYVFGLGDITDYNKPSEWAYASEQHTKMDGVIPYSVIRGNHDMLDFRNTTGIDYFNEYMGTAAYKSQFTNSEGEGGFYSEDDISNSWVTFTVGEEGKEIKYLLLTLDFGIAPDVDGNPDTETADAILEWAGNVVEAHPEHNVIITTHAYLYRDGTTLDDTETCPPSTNGGTYDGDDLWSNFVSQYENIVLVLCGHDPAKNVVVSQDEGVNGNIVTTMLIDPQNVDRDEGATGMVAMLYFSEDGKDVTVRYYSTVKEKYLLESNQFELEIAVVSADDTDSGAGNEGAGDEGTGDEGTGDAGTGDAGTGDVGTGDAGAGDTGTADSGDNNSSNSNSADDTSVNTGDNLPPLFLIVLYFVLSIGFICYLANRKTKFVQ